MRSITYEDLCELSNNGRVLHQLEIGEEKVFIQLYEYTKEYKPQYGIDINDPHEYVVLVKRIDNFTLKLEVCGLIGDPITMVVV